MGERFQKLKAVRKGIEGAILSGGAVEAVLQTAIHVQDIDVDAVEHASAVLVSALIGFVIKALKNYLKNRK